MENSHEIREVRHAQVRGPEDGVHCVGPRQVCLGQVCLKEIGPREVRALQAHPRQVG